MKASPLIAAAALLAGSPLSAGDFELSVGGLLQVWYPQMLDENLRRGSSPFAPAYYNLRSEFTENGFTIRRAEVKLSGRAFEKVAFEVMIDPSIGTASSNMLQDATIAFQPGGGFELKIGQFKTQLTHEGLLSSRLLVLAERGQLTRLFGDVRDRGATASYSFGRGQASEGRVVVGVFNGAGKANDANARKDVVARFEMRRRKKHSFGAYGLWGHSDLPDEGTRVARTFAGTGAPPDAAILDADDETRTLGAFYVFEGGAWHASVEGLIGLLGRRHPSLGTTPGPAARQHLDQQVAGLVLTGAYTRGHHTLALRYDVLDYNRGGRWYTDFDPYRESAPGVGRSADFTPVYTEVSVGYTYALRTDKPAAANLKLNYVARSRNFLAPRAGQTGEQGGDSLLAAFQVSF